MSIITPVYYTGASLPDLLDAFRALADRNPEDEFEFVFVDDGSGDDSLQVALSLAEQESRMRVIALSRNFGSTAAILAGLQHARGDAVGVIASDLQDPPELIHDMLGHWRAGRKVMIAAREGRDDPFPTSFLSDTFYALFRRFAVSNMPRHGFDFFVIDRQVVDLINGLEEKNTYLMGLILWLGFKPVVLTYLRRAREKRYGRSRWTFVLRIKYFIDAFVAFSYAPVRITSIIGMGLGVVGALYAALIIWLRLAYDIQVEGWSSLMVVVLVVSGIQMSMLGVLGEYLWRTLDATRRRPPYIVERIVEHKPAGSAPAGKRGKP